MFAPPQKIPNPQYVTMNLGWNNLFNATVFYMFLCVSMFFYEFRVEEHPMLRCISMFLCACVSMYFYVFLCSLR